MTILPVLENCVLFGTGRVVNGDISDFPLSAEQIGTLSVNVHDWKGFIVLERVESPPSLGNASLGRLVVFDHHPPVCVGVFRQRPRQPKVRFLFFSRRFVCASEIVLFVFFPLLPVFPAPLIVLLSLSLLGGERVSLSASVSVTVSLSWPVGRLVVCLPSAPSLLWLPISPPGLITTGLMPFLLLWDNRDMEQDK